jgi:hypothetical protein
LREDQCCLLLQHLRMHVELRVVISFAPSEWHPQT